MDPDTIIIRFIGTLPERERSLCILLRAYEKELKYSDTNEAGRSAISNLYENEIRKILPKAPVYDSRDMKKENAEKSVIVPVKDPIDDPFEAKLGKWASSFSNDSDLSSEDENDPSKKKSNLPS